MVLQMLPKRKTKHVKSPMASASCPVRELTSPCRPVRELAIRELAYPWVGVSASCPVTVYHRMCNAWLVQCQTYTYHPSQTALPLPLGQHSFLIPLRVGCWVGLSGWVHTKTVYLWTVTHLSNNWVRRKVTSLTRAMPETLGQTVPGMRAIKHAFHYKHILEWCNMSPTAISS